MEASEKSQAAVRVIGPRDRITPTSACVTVNTTSRGTWAKDLSPFHLGPCRIDAEHTAIRVENAWQFSKVYATHTDAAGEPTAAYWAWARRGWANPAAVRYPMAKGAKPLYLLHAGEKLNYVDGRLQVYWKFYRDAVIQAGSFEKLQEIRSSIAEGGELLLWDFDGYDHESCGMSLAQVLLDERRPMGHAFVLKAMLEFGRDVTPQHVLDHSPAAVKRRSSPQGALF